MRILLLPVERQRNHLEGDQFIFNKESRKKGSFIINSSKQIVLILEEMHF